MPVLKKGNNYTKRLVYNVLVRPILKYGGVCWGPYGGQLSALNRVQKKAAKFENNMSRVEKLWDSED